MESSSREKLFCSFHCGGEFVRSADSGMKYEGGNFTVEIDSSTFINLLDDVRVEQLFEYNGRTAHVYVTRRAALEDDLEKIDQFLPFLYRSSLALQHWNIGLEGFNLCNFKGGIPTKSGEDNLAIQCIPTPIPEMNANKWKDFLIRVGRTFAHAVALRKALYKYSLVHKFRYKFLKNEPSQVIVNCAVEGCPWYIGAYKLGGKDNSFLSTRTFKDQHFHFAQDNLNVAHKSRLMLMSSIIIDKLRASIGKSPNDIRRDIYREYGLKLSYYQAYRGKEKALSEIHGQPDELYMLIPWMC
ncbi:uncharacterized protein LOC129311430 [Prosopis cineraria]|uniref:uncharacterized protein LOC129311430 n=1 Tax=Prosopis cineraria TaxID=364024 RepID=UPI00240ED87B|nr:uncharacterized protein LOC129311430 [Prosopis cineraria]